MKRILTLLALFTGFMVFGQDKDEGFNWPREIQKNDYTIMLYQPQLETLKGNLLEGRFALSVKKKNEEPIFGASWFTVTLETDKSSRVAVLERIEIDKIKFPDLDEDERIEQLKKLIEEDIESVEITMSLENIIAALEDPESNGGMQDAVNNTPPKIYFRSKPAVLIVIDGEPILKEVEKSSLEYVVNTPFFIVKKGKNFYMKGENHWYSNTEIAETGWQNTTKIPDDVSKLASQKFSEEDISSEEFSDTPPEVIVVTKPAELIVTEGDLEYEPIKGTQLLFITNSESDIILDINTQLLYALINGRWYASKDLGNADWSFVEPSDLPVDFVKIPEEGTSISSVRSSVPGTEEAEEAKYDQYIPQTAKVDRKTATTEVSYDGEPKFEAIEGSKMSYAVNSQSTVLKLDNQYYVVDEGIWFESNSPKGPWAVADERPDEVDEIPASSPVYNVKYVYVYDSTPQYVYVGYTPGYYHSYYYGGVVVYGTGYYYRPWYGAYYYPRPVTYGFGVHYNPYTGWGFSVGVSYGWLTIGFSNYNYWGPRGYAHGYRHGYYHGYHRGYHNGYRAGYARGRYDAGNMYRGRRNYNNGRYNTRARNGVSTRNVDRSRVSNARNTNRNGSAARNTANNRRNNVYTDKSGNVFQRDEKGNWSQKRNGSTTPRANTTNNRAGNTTNRAGNATNRAGNATNRAGNTTNINRTRNNTNINSPSTRSNLQKQYNNRNRGNANSSRYNTNRSRPSSTRPVGGRRRG